MVGVKSPFPAATLLLGRFWLSYLKPHRIFLSLAFVCMGFGAFSTALLAHFLQPLFDDIFSGHQASRLWYLATLILGIFLMKGIANYGQMLALTYVGQKITATFQKKLFHHIISGDLSFFQKRLSGGLLSLLTYEMQLMRNGLTNLLLSIGRDILTLFFLVCVMVYKDPFLAVVAFLGFPLAIWPMRTFGRRMRLISFGSQEAMEHLNIFFQQAFQGIRLIKAYGMEAYEKAQAEEKIDTFLKFALKGARVRAALHPLMETLGGLAIVVVVLYGGYQVMTHTRTTGTFISFIAALLLAYEPLKKLVHLNTELQEGLSALSRLFGVLDTVPQVVDAPDAFSLKVSEGAIEIQDISFRYSDEAPLFKNLSLSITGGQKTAIVGPSGSGKSTLFNLLLRFYDVVAGKITIDAQPLDKVTLASLREKIAFVGQEIVLFNETILENIHYGRRDATFDQVVDAARAADAHDFIEALPKGYHTKIGEHGLKLSGGQRQRIAIARAMLKDAPLLLLDEATSSLDSQSETYVQKALERLMEGRTTLTIAHRLSTVERADKIFVLDRGEVVEEGNHDSLLNAGGLYARLVFPQLSE